MSTYYAAQLGIALSMVDSRESNDVNKMVIQHNDLINGVKRIVNHLKSIYFEDNLEVIRLNEANMHNKISEKSDFVRKAKKIK
jgi:hypothetical protein